MTTLRAIRKRIGAIRNTGQITRAMKMVAAARLRRAQERIVAGRPYADKVQEVLSSLAARIPTEVGRRHPLLTVREPKRAELIVMTSDRGLCGAYNNNVIRLSDGFIRRGKDRYEKVGLTVVGRKCRDYFRRRNYPITREYVGVAGAPTYGLAATIAGEIIGAYRDAAIDEAYIVYSRFVSALTQRPEVRRLLPVVDYESRRVGRGEVPTQSGVGGREKGGTAMIEYIFEPSQDEILRRLLPKYVEVQVFRAMMEAAASEHGARMTAMDLATRNTEDMVSNLTLEMNKARQSAITKELIDIVTGTEAQKRG